MVVRGQGAAPRILTNRAIFRDLTRKVWQISSLYYSGFQLENSGSLDSVFGCALLAVCDIKPKIGISFPSFLFLRPI